MLVRWTTLFSVFVVLLSMMAGSVRSETLAPYSLEIIQPLAGLNTNNRFYRAYPNVEYNVSAAVVGGAYPYTYSLDVSPSGMTVNAATGEIKWSSPSASATPYNVTLRVTDAQATVRTVSWTITVTTSGFAFVDAVNGSDSNPGTLAAPWKTFAKVYGGTDYSSKYSTANQNKFIYFKSGTYNIDGFTANDPNYPYVQYTNNQPVVLMAYPAQAPILDFNKNYLRFDSITNNLYVEGFEVVNPNQAPNGVNVPGEYYFAFRVNGGSKDVTFRRNHFHGLDGSNGGSNNQSMIMFTSAPTKGGRTAVIENEFNDVQNAYGIIAYSSSKVLIANNEFHNFFNPVHPIGPKDSCDHWFIRNNRLYDVTSAIWIYGNTVEGSYGDMEISYNYVSSTGNALELFGSMAPNTGIVHVFRNTFVGSVLFNLNLPTNLMYNVIINNASTANKITLNGFSSTSNISASSNLTGVASEGIVDSSGNLTANYQSYVGARGWEVGAGQNPPAPPQNFVVQPQ